MRKTIKQVMEHLSEDDYRQILVECAEVVFDHIHFLLEIEKLDEADINFETVRNAFLNK